MLRHSPAIASSGSELTISARTGRQYVPFLRRHLRAARNLLRSNLKELSVALVGDARMSALHHQFLDIPGPTDVLTFPLELDSRGKVKAGEVVVCVPYALREARRRGIPANHEILLYALHGMLHLSGFDDRTDASYRKMHKKEDDILVQLGFKPIFATTPKSPRKTTRSTDRLRFGA